MYLRNHPKTGMLEYRRIYPPEIAAVVGKREFKRSLGTRDKTEASKKYAIVEEAYNRSVQEILALAGIPLGEREKAYRVLQNYGLSPSSVDALTLEYVRSLIEYQKCVLRDMRSEVDQGKGSILNGSGIIGVISETKILLNIRLIEKMFMDKGFRPSEYDLTLLEPRQVQSLAKRLDLSLSFDDATEVKPNLDAIRKAKSDVIPQHISLNVQPFLSPASQRIALRPEFTFDMAYAEHIKVKNPAKGSLKDYDTAVKRFKAMHGNLPIELITKDQVRKFREACLLLPKTLTHKERVTELPKLLKQLGDKHARPTLTPSTVNKLLSALSTIYETCRTQYDFLSESSNPFHGMGVHEKIVAEHRKRRVPFTFEDLAVIFSSPVYTGCLSQRIRSKQGELVIKDARYWLPLLSLYTGARVEELGQLLKEDVCFEHEVHYIDINRNHGKTTKNKDSIRQIPIHSDLLRLGFVKMCDEIKGNGPTRLFPELGTDESERNTKYFSTQFGKYLKEIGVKPDKPNTEKVFHSFRHNFADALRNVEAPRDIMESLTGHKSQGQFPGYGDGYFINLKNKWLQKIRYEGISLLQTPANERARKSRDL